MTEIEILKIIASNNHIVTFCNSVLTESKIECGDIECIKRTLLMLDAQYGWSKIQKIEFDPWAYIAGYPMTINAFFSNGVFNEYYSCIAYIIYGLQHNLERNRFSYNNHMAVSAIRLFRVIHNKRLIILGNSVTMPSTMATFKLEENDVIVRFNKGVFQNDFKSDIVVFNSAILGKFKQHHMKTLCKKHTVVCPQGSHYYDVNSIDTSNTISPGNAVWTTGVLFLHWLITRTDLCYSSAHIAGFNMVHAGEKAHYFDSETPGKRSEKFPGHNADAEIHYISHLFTNPGYKIFKINDS